MTKEKVLERILVCLYVIIALLAVNTVILIAVNADGKSTKSNDTTATEENTEYDVSMMKEVKVDEFKEVAESKKIQVVYIGRPTCGYCVKFLPTLQKAQKEYKYKTVYLDITNVASQEDQEKILAYDNDEGFLKENFGSTPMVLLMKDGKLVDTKVGYTEYADFASFLEKNGITK